MEGLPHNLAKATWQPQITVRLQDLLLNDHSNPVTFDDDVDVTQLHDFPHLGFDTYQTETEKPFTLDHVKSSMNGFLLFESDYQQQAMNDELNDLRTSPPISFCFDANNKEGTTRDNQEVLGQTVIQNHQKKSTLLAETEEYLGEPLSELFNNVDFRDVEVYVNRPPEDRRTGLDVVQGAAKKPLNCFFLYKKVYKDHTADLFPEKSQNMISCILGASWRMESNFIRNKFRRLADVERSNHKKAFPSNKYASSRKRRTFRNPVE